FDGARTYLRYYNICSCKVEPKYLGKAMEKVLSPNVGRCRRHERYTGSRADVQNTTSPALHHCPDKLMRKQGRGNYINFYHAMDLLPIGVVVWRTITEACIVDQHINRTESVCYISCPFLRCPGVCKIAGLDPNINLLVALQDLFAKSFQSVFATGCKDKSARAITELSSEFGPNA
ncbi:MAG TPA: hypothetical protein VK074_09665, partial [Fodinibius sp.]|nr:hypothetical protein [Fodinibius sp.]